MLDANLSAALKQHLTNLRHPIELVASLDDQAKSGELRDLLTEIAGLSDLVTARFDGTNERRPSFAIVRPGSDIAVTFAAIPLGHEFTSLVLALLHVGGHPPKITDAEAAAIKGLPGTYDITTYMSLTCQICPDVIQALNIMAVLNPNVRHTVVDGALFRADAEGRHVLAVPTVFLGDQEFHSGRATIEEFCAKLDQGVADRSAEAISAKEPFDLLVVGGGPAGSAAAIYAARKGVRTGVVATRFGGQVLETLGIENLIAIDRTEGPQLGAAFEANVRANGVDVITNQAVSAITPAETQGGYIRLDLASGASLSARAVVLAVGAKWRLMNVPGEQDYLTKGVAFCPHCDGPLFKGKKLAVIGGGNSGIEAAIDLAGIVEHVTVLEFDSKLRADDVLQAKLRSLPNVEIHTEAQTTEVLGDGTTVTGLVDKDRPTGEVHTLELGGIFVQIGLAPGTDWLKGGPVELTPRGEIVIDGRGATNVPGVFAAGDCATTPYKQILIALGSGATAALSAFDYLIRTGAPA
jgi:alkyl hydroperoxide reductase subunit F